MIIVIFVGGACLLDKSILYTMRTYYNSSQRAVNLLIGDLQIKSKDNIKC